MADWERGSNLVGLYTHNRSVVLDVLRQFGPMTVGDISERIGLQPASVGSMVRELQEIGFVEQAGTRKSSGGRPPALYRISQGRQYALTADLSGSELSVGIVDLGGNLVAHHSLPIAQDHPIAFESLVEALDRMRQEADPDRLVGVGVAVPGILQTSTGHVTLSIPLRWTDFSLADELEKRLGTPVVVGRETEAAILAEHRFIERGQAKNLLLLNVGTGVGVGMILEGRPYRGSHDSAGEWGHTIVDPGGPMCWCGNRGCLEEVASLRALTRRVREIGRGSKSDPDGRFADDHDPVTKANMVLQRAAMGDRASLEAVDDVARVLGTALFNLVQVFDPELVIIDVSVDDGGPILCEAIKRYLRQYRLLAPNSRLEVRQSSLGGRAKLIGAGLWVFDASIKRMKSMLVTYSGKG